MISVDEALSKLFSLVAPLETETVALAEADGRVLRVAVQAGRDQPPFAASAMDGYAVCGPLVAGQRLRVIGCAAAGARFSGQLGPDQAVRIFTGAPVPDGADQVVIQEDVTQDGDMIILGGQIGGSTHIRARGADFLSGDTVSAPRRLRPVDLALLAAMNVAELQVTRRPDVAIIATGDELVAPGDSPGPDQIIAANNMALAAMARAEGAAARLLPIARDTEASLRAVFELAAGADVIVTIGGASVGAHDLVGPVARSLGAQRAFYKVAMRPGKPLMAGMLGRSLLLGLPGNPVSSIVCGHLFMRPVLRALLGLGAWPLPCASARLGCDLPANGPRAHYMRATLAADAAGPEIRPFDRQDSALLSVLAEADALLIRPPEDRPRRAGEHVHYIPL